MGTFPPRGNLSRSGEGMSPLHAVVVNIQTELGSQLAKFDRHGPAPSPRASAPAQYVHPDSDAARGGIVPQEAQASQSRVWDEPLGRRAASCQQRSRAASNVQELPTAFKKWSGSWVMSNDGTRPWAWPQHGAQGSKAP